MAAHHVNTFKNLVFCLVILGRDKVFDQQCLEAREVRDRAPALGGAGEYHSSEILLWAVQALKDVIAREPLLRAPLIAEGFMETKLREREMNIFYHNHCKLMIHACEKL